MVRVVYDSGGHTLTVEGHAGQAEAGKDLVCAAVSILVHTVEANLQLLDARSYLSRLDTHIAEGSASFAFPPRKGMEAMVSFAVALVVVGFEILAKEAPEYVSYTMME